MKLFLLIVSIGLILTGCNVKKHSIQTHVHDSIVFIEKIKIDTITVPSSIATAVIPLSNIKDTTIINYSNGQARVKLVVKNNKINCEAYCDSLYKLSLNKTITYKNTSNKNTSVSNSKTCNILLYVAIGVLVGYLSLGLILILLKFK